MFCPASSYNKHSHKIRRRQFEARVKQWGFRKNTSKSERSEIIQNFGTQNTIGAHGRAIPKGTVERWEKATQKHPISEIEYAPRAHSEGKTFMEMISRIVTDLSTQITSRMLEFN